MTRQRLADLIEEIEITGYEETKRNSSTPEEVEYFRFNYTKKDYDLLISLLDTTTEQYYLTAKPEIIDKVEFLKQDYGEDNLYFVNSSVFYAHLLNSFYNHHCKVFHSHFNDKDEMLDELCKNHDLTGEFELISA